MMGQAARVRALIDADWAAGFGPRTRPAPSAWAEANRVLTSSNGARRPWRNSFAPYLVEIMDACADDEVEVVSIMKSAQTGGTEALISVLMAWIDTDPASVLWVAPGKDEAAEVNSERLLAEFRATPATARRLGTGLRDIKSASVRFDRMRLRLAGSSSRAQLASWPMARIIYDEVDKYRRPQWTFGLGDARAISFRRRKKIRVSTPTDEGWGIDAEYKKGTRERFFIPCPLCGEYQTPRFNADPSGGGRGGVRWDGSLDCTPIEAFNSTRYECEACGGAIRETLKPWMLHRGLWVPEGVDLEGRFPVDDPAAPASWRPALLGELPSRRHRSFWIHGTLSPFPGNSWAALASDFVACNGEPDETWINERLGEPYRRPGLRTDADDFLAIMRATVDGEPPYKRGEVPPGVLVLTMSMDVQKDSVYYEVVGWGEQEGRWLIDYGVVACPMPPEDGSDIAKTLPEKVRRDAALVERLRRDPWTLVKDQIAAQYPRIDTGELETVKTWGVDSRHRRAEVYDLCRWGAPNGRAFQGAGGEPMLDEYRLQNRFDEFELYTLNTYAWKEAAFARMRRKPPALGAWRYPVDVSRAYALQLTAEERVEEPSKKGPRRYWRKRAGRQANHWWDCAVSGLAMAQILGLRQLTKADLVRHRQEQAARRSPPAPPPSR